MSEEKKLETMAMLEAAESASAEVAVEKKSDDEIRRLKKVQLIKIGIILFLVALVMIFATLGWFAMNKDTSASGMGVKIKAINFNIKSKGTIPYTAPFAAATEYKDGILDTNNEYHLTGTNNDNVKWRMADLTTEQLKPGAYGRLTFWVVPKDNQTSLDMRFSVSMRGFVQINGTWTEITDSTTLGYLNSHILFFKERYPISYEDEDETDFTYKGLITDPYTLNGLTESDSVTIYWVWPETFSQMIADASSASHIAYDSAALREIKDYVIAQKTNLFPSGTENLNDNVAACCSSSSTATASEIEVAIGILDTGYNAGDSVIGSQIRGALTVLKAEALAEHEITP